MIIGDFIERHLFDSVEATLRKVQHLPDGAGFLLGAENSVSAWDALFQLGPHADYDFDARHFLVTSIPHHQDLFALAKGLLSREQFVICPFQSIDLSASAESAFAEQFANGRVKPLILNFVSTPDGALSAWREKYGSVCEIVHVGYQPHCSRRETVENLRQRGEKLIPLQKVEAGGLLNAVEAATSISSSRPLWLRLDLNALKFSQVGTSRAWPTGLDLSELTRTIEWLFRQSRIQGVSVGPLQGIDGEGFPARSLARIFSDLIYAHVNRRIVSSAHGKR